jgi:beta-N-acetylhexosaminidase
MSLSIGPVILDLLGPELDHEEREILHHPLVGGIILFARNYADPKQVTELCSEIRRATARPILIMVDQEGGRVQRFRHGFAKLPAMGELGQFHAENPKEALQLAETSGWLMAAELLAVGVDISLAPVLDLNKKLNAVVGDRSFSQDPHIVITLAKQLIKGMKKAGMAAVGKHFPGHGSVALDSHLALPIDERSYAEIEQSDLIPFAELISSGINGIMPAHIRFPKVDDNPVGFSKHWLQTILRKQLHFSGVIFSDDLSMKGSEFAGDYTQRAKTALDAGCDFILACNNRKGAIQIIDNLKTEMSVPREKFAPLQGKFSFNLQTLHASSEWKKAVNALSNYLPVA